MKKHLKLVAIILATLMLFSGCSGEDVSTVDAEIPKVGLLTGRGGLGDNSFNDLCYNGTQQFEASELKVDLVEPTDINEMYGLVQQYADASDYLLTVCVGYEYTQVLSELAGLYPEQRFVLVDDVVDAENVSSVTVSPQQSAFQIGAYAGWMAKSGELPNGRGENKIGVVAAMDNDLLRTFVTGYMCGAKYVNPEVEIMTGFVGSFTDTQTAKELALNMYNAGCDIVCELAGGSGLGVFEAAKEMDLYALGSEGYKNDIDPDHILACAIRKLDIVVQQVITDAMNGEFEGGNHVYGAEAGAIEVSTEGSNVTSPAEVFDVVDRVTEMMAKGELQIPSNMEEVDRFIEEYGSFE